MELQNQTYRYTKLPPQHIRVLKLQPSSSSDAGLACQLMVQKIGDEPYQALSYVWGKPTVFRSVIHCQDGADDASAGTLAIGANLATALLAYRLPDRPRRIWVDAICIRQDDHVERQAQVRMMGDIFRNATQVLCWLGAFGNPSIDKATALLAIQFLREFNKDQTCHLRQIQAHLHDATNTDQTDGNHLSKTWAAVKAFFDLEYFHRAWIIQEIGLARQAQISWGNSEISIDWQEVAHFVLFLDDNGAAVINHLDLKSWVCNHINLVWSNDKDGKPLFDFSEVLHWARIHLSTDARDYVYSLLGHPSAVIDDRLIIEPKYTISTEEVYTNLAINVIERTHSLHILAFVDHGEEPALLNLPTWVPDWHALNLVAPLRYPTQAALKEVEGIIIESSSEKPSIRCRGVIVGTISAYSDMINPKELPVTDYDTEKKKDIPFLIDHLYEKLVSHQDGVPPTAENFIHALSSVLTGAFRGRDPATSGETLHKQRADCAAYIAALEKLKGAEGPLGFINSLTTEDKTAITALAAAGSANQFVQDMTWTSMCRRVFRTTDGRIGIGPRIMKDGDICTVVKGSVYPLVLRRSADHYQLVGPALVYGFMNQEAQVAYGKGDFDEQEICIC